MASVDMPFAATHPQGDRPSEQTQPQEDFLPWQDQSPSAIDLRAMWATMFRNRYVMIAILAAAMLLGVVSVLVMPRIYQARASIQIDQQVAKVLGTEDTEPLVSGVDADRFLQTQVDVLRSRAMARRVAERLGLAANDRFLERMSGSAVKATDAKEGSRADRVIDTLGRNLTIDMRRNSRVVGIYFTSRDPALATEIANSFVSNYIEGNIQRKFSTSAYSRDFLQTQLGLAKGRLEESERALIGYARSARLIDASAGGRPAAGADGPRSLVTANLVQLNSAYAEAEAVRLQALERWEQARRTPLMSLPEVLTNEAVQRLTQKRAEDMARLNEIRQRLKPDHPTVIQVTSQLAALDQQIRSLSESIRDSIRNQYLTAERQHGALDRQVNNLKSATLAEQDRSVRYNILQREVDTNRQLYESLLQRYKEVSAEAGIATNNVSIVDPAETPRKPTSPRPLINLALATFGGLVLAIAYAFGREYFDDALRDPQEVESKLHLPVLGVVPESTEPPLVALEDSKSYIAEAYHTIRTAIELSSTQGVPRSIVITSSSKSEGKSTTSYALARDFAMLDRKVLIIDADLRRPSLHRLFNRELADRGLSSTLARLHKVEDVILSTPVPNLSFLPSGPLPPDPATLFAGAAMSALIEGLTETFDVVIIDGPPVLALADATQLSAAAQATIFVAEAGSAHLGQVRNAVSRLQRAGGHLIGVIVTKYNARKAGYGYAYDYYRYRYDDTSSR